MTAIESQELASVLDQIRQWPESLRLELAREVLEDFPESTSDTPPRRLPPNQIIGILKTDRPPPTDGECRQIVDQDRNRTVPLVSGRGWNWQLWRAGAIERQIEGITPLLASWESKSDPAQVRLQAYLDSVMARLLPLPADGPLFLHLDVDVGDPQKLLRHYDLENYLTPFFGSGRLPSRRFVLASARKYVGGGSRLRIGAAIPHGGADNGGWTSFSLNAGRGTSQKDWKARIVRALTASALPPVEPGRAKVRLAWRCAPGRNWTSLWKPTGDAMGPVLGMPDPQSPFQLNDDRIVDLELHRNDDDTIGHDVVVGMWWRGMDSVS